MKKVIIKKKIQTYPFDAFAMVFEQEFVLTRVRYTMVFFSKGCAPHALTQSSLIEDDSTEKKADRQLLISWYRIG